MSVSFEDFLESAEELLKNTDSKEIDFRNLISRSYYAMFHLSIEVAQQLPPIANKDKNYGSHEAIFVKFEYSANKDIQQLAEMMYKRKNNRVRADYYLNETINRLEAARHFYAIKAIIKKLQQAKERLE